jgi:HPt (histidine-containing phosphotransfer) domain-containing protein
VEKLEGQLGRLEDACRRRDFPEIARLAHWLKGAAPTMGFGAFHRPAAALERAAQSRQEGTIDALLSEVLELAASVQASAAGGAASSVAEGPDLSSLRDAPRERQ